MSIETKFENFKQFVQDISSEPAVIDEYKNMSWFKLQALGYVLLVPNRNSLNEIAENMRLKLGFDQEHLPKFTRYLELFVEYLAGESPDIAPEYITSQDMSFEERIARYQCEQEKKNL